MIDLNGNGKVVQLPSVTTILKVINKPALMKWAAKQAAKAVLSDPQKYNTPELAADAIYDIRDESTERGRDAHKIAEDFVAGIHQPTHPYYASIKSFFETKRPEVFYTEVLLVNTQWGYAGTADLIARVGPKTYVVDYKSSKAAYPEYHLQVEAYRQCDLAILKDGTRIELHPMADAASIVLLRPDETFQWVEAHGDFGAFLAALTLFYWWSNSNDPSA